jgi:hypothetical protein
MPSLKCQGVLLNGASDFKPVNHDYEYFIYGGDVYCIQDFEEYEEYDMDYGSIEPVGTESEWKDMEYDERDYFNLYNLYGVGEDIHLECPETSAVLITNAKGF